MKEHYGVFQASDIRGEDKAIPHSDSTCCTLVLCSKSKSAETICNWTVIFVEEASMMEENVFDPVCVVFEDLSFTSSVIIVPSQK